MLPAGKRLTRHQFTLLLSDPALRVVFNRLGTFKYVVRPTSQFSVVTSSKHEKKAVRRNKIRRRIYSLLATLPYSYAGVLYVSKQAYTMEYGEIKALYENLIQKSIKHT